MDNDNALAWSLIRGMARTLGLNLVEAVTEGWFTRAELACLVDRCSACGLSDHCSAWLAVTPRAKALPSYCRNKSDLEVMVM